MKTFSKKKLAQTSIPSILPEKRPKNIFSYVSIKEVPYGSMPNEEENTEAKQETILHGKYSNKKEEYSRGRQLILNMGQKKYTKCHLCGVMYSETLPSEIRLHRKLHKAYVSEQKHQSEET
ncbi:hypothetical protein NEIG_01806 [Nematocida sp. ERTm5]|nr:hypothetical protein NEIG_01806 [Nematocida sp. ERTm5]